MSIVIALIAGIAGLLLNPLINRMAHDPKAANPLPAVRYWFLGAPVWLGLTVGLLMGVMALFLFNHFGLSGRFAYWLAMCAVVIVVGAVDWKVRLIDVLVLLVASIIAVILAQFSGVGLKQSLIGALVGGLIFTLFFALAYVMFPGSAVPFGLGDVYLAIFIGALLGIVHMGSALFYGMILAGIASLVMMARRQRGSSDEMYMSYGTYLCLGVLIYLAFWGQTI